MKSVRGMNCSAKRPPAPKSVFSFLNQLTMSTQAWNALLPDTFSSLHTFYIILGLFILLFSYLSFIIKTKMLMTEALMACLCGILVGPHVFKVVGVVGDPILTLMETSRLVLGLQCFLAGAALPKKYMQEYWKDLMMILGPVLLTMWLVSSLGVFVVFRFGVLDCLLLGACITPTDPVLASALIEGEFSNRYISKRMKNLISAESAANDGLGLCYLFLPIYLSKYASADVAMAQFFLRVILYQIILGIAIGVGIGLLANSFGKVCFKKGLIHHDMMPVLVIALVILVVGICSRLGVDDILATFAAGVGISWFGSFEESLIDNESLVAIDSLVNVLYFVLVGSMIPFDKFGAIGWGNLLALATWILFLRRLPVVMIFRNQILSVVDYHDGITCGWFGPIGASALFYATTCVQLESPIADTIVTIVFFIVLSSIMVHGLSASIFHFVLRGVPSSSVLYDQELERIESMESAAAIVVV